MIDNWQNEECLNGKLTVAFESVLLIISWNQCSFSSENIFSFSFSFLPPNSFSLYSIFVLNKLRTFRSDLV